jgi:mono/diheme cytochrome c family protein
MRPSVFIFTFLLFVQLASSAWAQNAPDSVADNSKRKYSVYAEMEKAPDKFRSKQNPLKNDPEAIAAGGNLYEQHCAECHGSKAEGRRKKGPSLLVSEVQSVEPGAIFWILTNGVVRRGMPVWSKLPEPQRWQLVTFLKSLRTPPRIPVEQPSP